MAEKDIIEIKPGAYGINFDLREFWRRYISKKKEDPVTVVARRFLQAFEQHGVAVSQIPLFIPALTLDQLRSPDSLLPALTPNHLHFVAQTFHIRLSWLDGTSDVIYDGHWSYKNPWAFFEDLQTLDFEQYGLPVAAFTSAKKLDWRSNKDQPVLLVMRELSAQLGEKTIYRYRIHDQFLWGYWKSRIQLKAMMRVFYKGTGTPVRLYRISDKALREMEEGRLIPYPYYKNSQWVKGVELEDFSLMPMESRKAKEVEELPTVLKYIDAFKLEGVGKEGVSNPFHSEAALWFTQ